MATDVEPIISNLARFYDFSGINVISVGAGGGQLVEYARLANHVIAVDIDGSALELLAERLESTGLVHLFELRHADLLEVTDHADVVLFEFCLHEMADPRAALDHAKGLAPDVVVFDHAPTSAWAYHVDEEEKAATAWRAVAERNPRRTVEHETTHVFADHAELVERVQVMGERAVRRAEGFRSRRPVEIPTGYRLALI